MLQHAQRVSGSVSQTCRFFGVSRSLYYIWRNALKAISECNTWMAISE